MTELENLVRDITTLKESIKLNSTNLHQLAPKEIQGVLEHTALCLAELEKLQGELKRLSKEKN